MQRDVWGQTRSTSRPPAEQHSSRILILCSTISASLCPPAKSQLRKQVRGCTLGLCIAWKHCSFRFDSFIGSQVFKKNVRVPSDLACICGGLEWEKKKKDQKNKCFPLEVAGSRITCVAVCLAVHATFSFPFPPLKPVASQIASMGITASTT